MIENCPHGSTAPLAVIKQLPKSQGGHARHKCAVCAFAQGKAHARSWFALGKKSDVSIERCLHDSVAPINLLDGLPQNQGGVQRHKCPVCSYQYGYGAGLTLAQTGARSGGGKKRDEEAAIKEEPPPTRIYTLANPARDFVGWTEKDFVEQAKLAQELGLMGEIAVLRMERQALKTAGRDDLAESVCHIARLEGDGAGYDVLSFTPEGTLKFIEVKTTEAGRRTPFYITQNEVRFSTEHAANYYLYRLYDFEAKMLQGTFYIIEGSVDANCELTPTQYRAALKKK